MVETCYRRRLERRTSINPRLQRAIFGLILEPDLVALVLVPELGYLCDCLLRSLVDLLNKHPRLAQMWRVSRAAPFHLRLGACCKHFLVLRGSSVIILADEVGGRDVAPGGARELGSLYPI